MRDFIETEKNSKRDAIVALHDCFPYSPQIASRVRPGQSGAWTGDAWKILPILREYRPDLKITCLGCKPTGLVMVSNLQPGGYELEQDYNAIIDDWIDTKIETYGFDRLFSETDFVLCEAALEKGLEGFNASS